MRIRGIDDPTFGQRRCQESIIGSEQHRKRKIVWQQRLTQKQRTGQMNRIITAQFPAPRQGKRLTYYRMVDIDQSVLGRTVMLKIAQQSIQDRGGQDAVAMVGSQRCRDFNDADMRERKNMTSGGMTAWLHPTAADLIPI